MTIFNMNDFNLEEWKKKKDAEAGCNHDNFMVTLGTMINGRPIRRFSCVVCGFANVQGVQHFVDDNDRVIASKKHAGKTLAEIALVDMPYLYWVAVQSKMPQADRYACARVCANSTYTVPADGDIVERCELYDTYVTIARDYITSNGGTI